ncbi:MAG TPA: GTP-binding protein [Tepidisphaeraceae bacterium]|jgi:small GTP-binding protein
MNRAIVLTGSGSAAIAVVRIEGAGTSDFLRDCFDRPVKQGFCVYGRIHDGERVIDDVMIAMKDNHADLNLHGGIWIVQEVLNLLTRRGFQIITWSPEQTWGSDGEDELEQEIAAYLPLAKTELAVNVLLNQPLAWKQIDWNNHEQLQEILTDRTLDILLHPPSVAIVGLPNVGKSTLANQLFGQERSITADVPGTTRDWVGELANVDGLVVKLIDTPGQRVTSDTIETRAIAAANGVIATAELIVIVIDPTQEVEEQKKLVQRWPEALLVINKSDLAEWNGNGVRTAASLGTGMDELRHAIRCYFDVLNIDPHKPRCWTDRQRTQIENILRANSPQNH